MYRCELEDSMRGMIATSMGEDLKNILDMDISPNEMGKKIIRLKNERETLMDFITFIIEMDEKLDKILDKLDG